MKTIAFITRVHPQRPNMLRVCVDSIKAQTSDNYIHILLRDDKTEKGYGVTEANRAFVKMTSVDAKYIMVLDDDDMLVDTEFVSIFEDAIEDDPELVFFKGVIDGKGVYPRAQFWGKTPKFAAIASFCLAIRLDIWTKYITEFGKPTKAGLGGDYTFISACFRNTKKHIWLDRIVAKTQKKADRGKGELDHI